MAEMKIPSQDAQAASYSASKPPLEAVKDIEGNEFKLVAVRRPTALVTRILMRTNNFFLTGEKGLEHLGISDPLVLSEYLDPKEGQGFPADEVETEHNHDALPPGELVQECPACMGRKRNPDYDPTAGALLLPGLVEVLLLLTCSKEDLYAFEDDFVYPSVKGRPGELLRRKVNDFLEKYMPAEVMKNFEVVSGEFQAISTSTTKVVDLEEGKQTAKGLGEA